MMGPSVHVLKRVLTVTFYLFGRSIQRVKAMSIVAVVDGGIDVTHEDLVDNLYVNEKEKNGQPGVDDDGNGFVDDVNGYNFVEAKDVVGGTIEPDDEGHGTHVAGTVAAEITTERACLVSLVVMVRLAVGYVL